ncbi:glycosyltransferase family 2 protein [Croceivirga sp. JEA036]|uniref:glycosyltransferase family 2 protein n=1 Tax=Croceivirga sp. JEA036 TaxID=2721162 RepID=UPI001438F210|nr:glycosyltransferase family 2 protein [Croceivirga sp. JEA036]NJB35387.1 glycosyltransferase family 2 protein [Croceivirga sp. JEA036]
MISVVIPLYNKAHTIVNTLHSVLKQTFTSFEVIIVNDGSTDNSVQVIQEYSNDKRIRIINQNNQGVSVARNNGVAKAKYKFIAFLDGDDEWLPQYLENMVSAIQQFPNAGMYCCAGFIRNGKKTVTRLAQKYADKIVEIDFFENPHVFLHTSATIISREKFFKTTGFPNGLKRNEDFALFFQFAMLYKVIYVGFPLSIYVGGVAGQATETKMDKVMLHVIRRYQIVHSCYKSLEKRIEPYKIFTRYELRHQFLNFINGKKYDTLEIFINDLPEVLNDLFTTLELKLILNRNFSKLAKMYILLTKVRWRLRGYPIVNN